MKRIVLILTFLFLFSGCARKSEPECRVVTSVQVQYQKPGDTITRTYTRTESIQSILTYLRILHPHGPVIPETASESMYQITLHYSHGPDSIFLQQGNAYLRRDNGNWESIDNNSAPLLYPLLLLLPSDS